MNVWVVLHVRTSTGVPSQLLLNGVTLYLHSGPINTAHKHYFGPPV